jgi:hypothetical protein
VTLDGIRKKLVKSVILFAELLNIDSLCHKIEGMSRGKMASSAISCFYGDYEALYIGQEKKLQFLNIVIIC